MNKAPRTEEQVAVQQDDLAPPKESESEETIDLEGEPGKTLPRALWSGSLQIGLVNIPVKAVSMTRDMRISFRMLHRSCKTPISFKRFCGEGKEVPREEIIYGYPLDKDQYLPLEKREVESLRPESSRVIELDRFVNFFQVDPHFMEKSYILIPDTSEKAYSLLREVMETTGKGAIGRMTISHRERPVLVHYYRGAVVATILHYRDEVLDPSQFRELSLLPAPGSKELDLAREIVDRLSGDLNMDDYHDRYREKIEELVRSRISGEVIKVERKRPRSQAKDLMDALRKTADGLKDR